MSLRAAGFVLLGVASLVACTADSPTGAGLDPGSVHLDIIGWEPPTAPVMTEIATPLIVRVTAGKGERPVIGALVNFVVTAGGGNVWAGSALTDQQGRAVDYWTLGPVAGTQTVEVRAVDGNGNQIAYATFTATATPAAFDKIVLLNEIPLEGISESSVPRLTSEEWDADRFPELVLELQDEYGNPVKLRGSASIRRDVVPGAHVDGCLAHAGAIRPSTWLSEGSCTTVIVFRDDASGEIGPQLRFHWILASGPDGSFQRAWATIRREQEENSFFGFRSLMLEARVHTIRGG